MIFSSRNLILFEKISSFEGSCQGNCSGTGNFLGWYTGDCPIQNPSWVVLMFIILILIPQKQQNGHNSARIAQIEKLGAVSVIQLKFQEANGLVFNWAILGESWLLLFFWGIKIKMMNRSTRIDKMAIIRPK